jgi:hypothetical protein
MDTLNITFTNSRAYDGLVAASKSTQYSPEDFARVILEREGAKFADHMNLHVITSSAFISRFTPEEYGVIVNYSRDVQPLPEYPEAPILPENPTQEELDNYDLEVIAHEEALVSYEELAAPINAHNAQVRLVKDLITLVNTNANIHLDDPRVGPGLQLLESLNLLSSGRASIVGRYDRPTA